MTSDNINSIEVDHAVALASAIVSVGSLVAPSLRQQLVEFGDSVGVGFTHGESTPINLVVFERLIRFANSVDGQAVMERIWDVSKTLGEPIQDSFSNLLEI